MSKKNKNLNYIFRSCVINYDTFKILLNIKHKLDFGDRIFVETAIVINSLKNLIRK